VSRVSNNNPPAVPAAPDLAYAPPAFELAGGRRVVFVDFTEADCDIRIRRLDEPGAVDVRVVSRLEFVSGEPGYPAFCLRQPISALTLDGQPAHAVRVRAPDEACEFLRVDRAVSPGAHTLLIESAIERLPGSTFDPVRWVGRPAGVQCLFEMSDRGAHKGFLDSYLPSNFEYDHIAMTLRVALEGVDSAHRIISNGEVEALGGDHWRITYPPHFTSSSILFHLTPELLYDTLDAVYASRIGPAVPVLVYAPREQVAFGVIRMEDYRDAALSALRSLENDFGPFPHPRLIIYAKGPGTGGMEYAGATVSRIGSIRHELDHSYFARCVTPANGDAGWMDEAIASWGDDAYKVRSERPERGANIAKRSPYERTTSPDAYTIGRDLIAHLDHLCASKGGMRSFLRHYFDTKRRSTVDAAEFQHMVEDFHGQSLEALFDEFVYNTGAAGGAGDGGGPDQPAHHRI
jgi:hypothetical protein